MPLVHVEIADLKLCDDPEAELITYGLGSCIAVTAWDRPRRIGAMLHYMLPSSTSNAEKARRQPGMFGDSGLQLLLASLERCGCRLRDLDLRAAGGAKRWDDGGLFDIGRRNELALRKELWKKGLVLTAHDLGGTRSRTVRLRVADGTVVVRSDGIERLL